MSYGQPLPLQCELCSKSFSGPAPAAQHFASQDHKKKEQVVKNARFAGPFCSVCNKQCDTEEVLQMHCQSPRHLATLEKRRSMQSGSPRGCAQETQMHLRSFQCDMQNKSTKKPQEDPTDTEYVFSRINNKGYCNLCNIELTSQSHAQSHIAGQKHKKKSEMLERHRKERKQTDRTWHVDPVHFTQEAKPTEAQLQTASAAATAYTRHGCAICCLQFNGPIQQAEHIISDKHINKVKMLQERPGMDEGLTCNACGETFRDQWDKNDHFENKKHHKQMAFLAQKLQPDGLSPELYCSICDVTCTSAQNKADHERGRKHMRNVENKRIRDQHEALTNTTNQIQNSAVTNIPYQNQWGAAISPAIIAKSLCDPHVDQNLVPSEPCEKIVEKPTAVFYRSRKDEDADSYVSETHADRSFIPLSQNDSLMAKPFATATNVENQTEYGSSGSQDIVPDFSSLNIKPVSPDVYPQHKALPLNSNTMIEEREQTDNRLFDDISETMSHSSFDIKSEYSNMRSEADSGRHTLPYREVRNELNSGFPISGGRGRGIWQFANSLPGKVMNADYSSNMKPEVLVLKKETMVEDDAHSETFRKELFFEDARTEPSQAQLIVKTGQLKDTLPGYEVETQSVRDIYSRPNLERDESKPESEDSLVQEGIQFKESKMTDHAIFSQNTTFRPLQQPQAAVQPQSTDEYVFDERTGRGRCFVCDVEFTSWQHKEQHVSGKNHGKVAWAKRCIRLSELRHGSTYDRFHCTICSCTFTCVEAKEQHLLGARHKQNQLKASDTQISESFYCDICKVSCSSQGNLDQHKMGAQHRKKAVMQGLVGMSPDPQGIDKTQWYPCEVCRCNLNSFEQLKIHQNSPAHLTKLSKLQNPVSGIDIGADRTQWYPCSVCNCQLNTLEQLRIHEKTPKHLAKLQKLGYSQNPDTNNSTEPQRGLSEARTSPYSLGTPLHENIQFESPLDSFLSQELFPEEFLPAEMSSTPVDGRQPSPVELKLSDVVYVAPDRYAHYNPGNQQNTSNNNVGGEQCQIDTKKRCNMTDLAFATRNKSTSSSCKQKSENMPGIENRGEDRIPANAVVNPYAATHKYYCHTCKSPMNTLESYESHLKGKRHMQKVCTEPAPYREHLWPRELPNDFVPPTLTKPRNYQIELYQKATKEDSLVFLPTGTGKTMVSVMTMSAMLTQYPTKNILFLVDKVLLVFQQSKYIRQEIGDCQFERFNGDSESCTDLVKRHLRIAALCMGQQGTGGIPLWKHDIVVVTAGFCQNLLDKGVLRWSDFSLVVFDEAHHCEKSHPFNSLLNKYHCNAPSQTERPRILGLTASPAGKPDVPKTLIMLQTLVSNMGGVRMCIVQRQECKQTLTEYQSNAEIIIKAVPVQQEGNQNDVFAQTLKHEMNVYILFCVLKLMEISNIKYYMDFGEQIKPGMTESIVRMLADDFVETQIDVIQSSLVSVDRACPDDIDKVRFSYLTKHIGDVCMARSSLFDGGIFCAWQDLTELNRQEYGFEFARQFGLKMEALEKILQSNDDIFFRTSRTTDNQGPFDHHACHLIDELTCLDYGLQDSRSISLVLVKQRSTAYHLSTLLQASHRMQEACLKTATVVGHGGSGTHDGMNVRQQKRMLEEIKQFMYQVIIATSVAEEGVDWPECDRVISMYPPSTVTALIQMRGRARRKTSKFIVLCSSPAEEEKLKQIMEREKNMMVATLELVNLQNQLRQSD